MKRLVALSVSFVLVGALAACTADDGAAPSTTLPSRDRALPAPAAAPLESAVPAAPGDKGTIKVFDELACAGADGGGNNPKVTNPFSIGGIGFDAGRSGTLIIIDFDTDAEVSRQPFTVGSDGTFCATPIDLPPGKYAVTYDFGNGEGKNKVFTVGIEPTTTTASSSTTSTSSTSTTTTTVRPSTTTTTVRPTTTTTVRPSTTTTVRPTTTTTVRPSTTTTVRPTTTTDGDGGGPPEVVDTTTTVVGGGGPVTTTTVAGTTSTVAPTTTSTLVGGGGPVTSTTAPNSSTTVVGGGGGGGGTGSGSATTLPPTTPDTGSSSVPTALLAALLAGLGYLMVRLSRRSAAR